MSARISKPIPERLLERMKGILESYKQHGSDSCWEWGKYRNPQTGYGQMSCWVNGKAMQFTAHRVALSTLSLAPQSDSCALHKCDNRGCINPHHLYWGEQSQNIKDMFDRNRNPDRFALAKRGSDHWSAKLKDRLPKGEKHPKAKLTDSAVAYIRGSSETLEVLAAMYGVTQTAVSYAKRGKTWKHVNPMS
jgi:hypothetical protein